MKGHAELRRLFLAKAAVAALAVPVPVIAGLIAAPRLRAQAPEAQSAPQAAERPSFDVASIKPNKSGDNRVLTRFQPGGLFTETNAALNRLIILTYQLKPHQMIAGPEWDRLLAEHFDIEAKVAGKPSREQMALMMQSLLADRFKLVVHHETRQLPLYALVFSKAGKTGPQLIPHSDDAKCIQSADGLPVAQPGPGQTMPAYCGGFSLVRRPGGMRDAGNKVTLDMLIGLLGNYVDRPVVDRTGLSGTFDLTLEFTLATPPGFVLDPMHGPSDSSGRPSLFTALQEQLGLKLESQTGPVDVLVIDHVEQPSEN